MIRLRELFHTGGDLLRAESGILVVVEHRNRSHALLVDDLVGIRQVVLKPLDGLHLHRNFFAGGALMGDGGVSLVVDLDRLLTNGGTGEPVAGRLEAAS